VYRLFDPPNCRRVASECGRLAPLAHHIHFVRVHVILGPTRLLHLLTNLLHKLLHNT
jgi:hypothetical protein